MIEFWPNDMSNAFFTVSNAITALYLLSRGMIWKTRGSRLYKPLGKLFYRNIVWTIITFVVCCAIWLVIWAVKLVIN